MKTDTTLGLSLKAEKSIRSQIGGPQVLYLSAQAVFHNEPMWDIRWKTQSFQLTCQASIQNAILASSHFFLFSLILSLISSYLTILGCRNYFPRIKA